MQKKRCIQYDCLYSAGEYQDNACNYILITGNKRNCKANKKCNKYKKSTADERQKSRIKFDV